MHSKRSSLLKTYLPLLMKKVIESDYMEKVEIIVMPTASDGETDLSHPHRWRRVMRRLKQQLSSTCITRYHRVLRVAYYRLIV